jgi:predicted nucleic acid-binding protein
LILLVDTSVWIDFFAGRDTPQTRFFKAAIREGADVALTELILAEILQVFLGPGRSERPCLQPHRLAGHISYDQLVLFDEEGLVVQVMGGRLRPS